MEDKELIDLFNSRSEQAVQAAKDKFGCLCKKIILNIVKNMEDCEECENDTYLKLWNTIPPQQPQSLTAYISRIAKNTALSKYRSNHRQKRGSGEIDLVFEELEELTPSSRNIQAETEDRETVKAVNEFLEQLPKDRRIIFVRRYWFCHSVKDIAEDTELTGSNVSAILSRTKTALKDYLKERGLYGE
ncbi:MAG: RNA polymerase sigma factor [Firmicutes bacterium]|nr:RNA polymerase sigma factor [Bacillota bacterium]